MELHLSRNYVAEKGVTDIIKLQTTNLYFFFKLNENLAKKTEDFLISKMIFEHI